MRLSFPRVVWAAHGRRETRTYLPQKAASVVFQEVAGHCASRPTYDKILKANTKESGKTGRPATVD